jgi:osmoprotectant transport system substrate-binding protein
MKKGLLGTMMLVLSLALLSACGSANKIVIGAQTYSEVKVIAEMYKALIEDRTDLKVQVKPDLSSSPVVINAMKSGEVDMATLYSGEIFNNHFELKTEPKTREEVVEAGREGFAGLGITWFEPYGFENTYAFTVRKEVADQLGLKTISDLKEHAKNMKLGVDTTWLERPNDGYKAFSQHYGIEFGQTFPMEIGLVYEAVANKEVDIVLAYSSDARIKEFNLVTLTDDKQFFPPYDALPVARTKVLEEHPELKEIIPLLHGKITLDKAIALNYEVDVNKRSEREVALEFLRKEGLLE